MQERILENLILENEDYIFAGNLTIKGKVLLKNASLIVSGDLRFSDNDGDISINGGDISATNLYAYDSTIIISDGDIYVECLDVVDILCDGCIEVTLNTLAHNIKCCNYFVYGDNSSGAITAIQDVYILGCNDSSNIEVRDIFIGGSNDSFGITSTGDIFIGGSNDSSTIKSDGDVFIEGNSDFNHNNLICKHFSCKGLINDCSCMIVK